MIAVAPTPGSSAMSQMSSVAFNILLCSCSYPGGRLNQSYLSKFPATVFESVQLVHVIQITVSVAGICVRVLVSCFLCGATNLQYVRAAKDKETECLARGFQDEDMLVSHLSLTRFLFRS